LPGDALAQQDSVAGRNTKKFGDPPNRVGLEFVDRPIGKCDIPQHFHDFFPTVIVESALQDVSKIVEINSFAVALFREGDQFRGGICVEAEAFLDDFLQPAPLGEADLAIDIGTLTSRATAARRRSSSPRFLAGAPEPLTSAKRFFRASNIAVSKQV
jgi:hypothetical protein